MKTPLLAFFLFFSLFTGPLLAQKTAPPALGALVDKEYASLAELYLHLHRHPELSYMEVNTARRMADELKAAGCEVHEGIGGLGVLGIMRNGPGKTILVRADMDGLPVKEETGLAYASTAVVKDSDGREAPAMHACGHDLHMTSLVGAARLLGQLKSAWRGTVLLVAQSAEEKVGGAVQMMNAGIYEKFGRPEVCVSLHASASLAAGRVGYCPEYALANVNSVDITVYGEGGHGAYPHLTKDPVVLSAQIIAQLQALVSREVPALEAAVVTVGSIHGGSKHNIVPNEVKLQVTVRTYSDAMRRLCLSGIQRICRGAGIAAGLPEAKLPKVEVSSEAAEALYNDPALTARVAASLRRILGDTQVEQVQPVMVSEDFGVFGRRARPEVPVCMYWLGTVDPAKLAESTATGQRLPTLHSGDYYPVYEPSIRTGVKTMTGVVLDLLAK
jgi:hippurate hydrolase